MGKISIKYAKNKKIYLEENYLKEREVILVTTIVFRTLIIYIVLICVMRLMGKRQIGELEITDLVTTLLISEIASLPITNQEIPISYAIIPMLLLLILEVSSSVILIRFPALKSVVSARPTTLIHHGHLNQRALREMRVSLDELLSEIRQQGLTALDQVEHAILEKDGKMTVIAKAPFSQPTAADLGLKLPKATLMHVVYSNQKFSKAGLELIGRDRTWLEKEIARRGLTLERLFCITADESGKLFYLPKEDDE